MVGHWALDPVVQVRILHLVLKKKEGYMPCRDDGPPESYYLKIELDKVTRLLCEVLTKIDDPHTTGIDCFVSAEASKWFEQHKIADEKRRVEAEKVAKAALKAKEDSLKRDIARSKREAKALERQLQELKGKNP